MPVLIEILLWIGATAGIILLSLRFGGYKGWSTVLLWVCFAAVAFVGLWLVPANIVSRNAFVPYFCANRAGFYSLTQTEQVSILQK